MIASVADFIRYFEGVRRRTWAVVDRLSPALHDWAPREGEWTCGQIVRHLAGAERFFVAKAADDRFTPDLDPGPWRSPAETRELLESAHRDALARLRTLDAAALSAPRRDLDGGTVKAWRFLMAMVEHEVHHRSQLDSHLAAAGVEPPQVFGWRMEDVVDRAAAPPAATPAGGPV